MAADTAVPAAASTAEVSAPAAVSDAGAAPGASAAPTAAAPARLQPGARVVVQGLVGAKELNGLPGKVVSYEEAKGRYAVQLSAEGAPKLLKPENLAPAAASATNLKELLAGDPAAAKFARLAKRGDLGFVHFGDAALRSLIRRLLEAGIWAEQPDMVKNMARSLDLAEHPSGPDAIQIIRRLENAAVDDLEDVLGEMGKRVKGDAGLTFVFDELRSMGHQFEF
eukprot:TRINITY_DN47269_c0_g1_i1.p1 TRINITY_DN47269_c0_g1~~TRINITY_DN47269_c0_g1_i1.p1  ORF type:complete len:233 (+),score=74.50 TRINITY_DN47269_c0_g1_i1:30-701(+)